MHILKNKLHNFLVLIKNITVKISFGRFDIFKVVNINFSPCLCMSVEFGRYGRFVANI